MARFVRNFRRGNHFSILENPIAKSTMSEIIVVEAGLIIAEQGFFEEYIWLLRVRTAESLYDSNGQRLRSFTRSIGGGSERLTHSAAARAHGADAANHAAQVAQRVCDALEQKGQDAAMHHYIGATPAQLYRYDYSRIDHAACTRELDELLAAANTHVCAARTAELAYLQAADEALAKCLIRKGVPQSCAKGWLHKNDVFYTSGLHYASDAHFPLTRVVFEGDCY